MPDYHYGRFRNVHRYLVIYQARRHQPPAKNHILVSFPSRAPPRDGQDEIPCFETSAPPPIRSEMKLFRLLGLLSIASATAATGPVPLHGSVLVEIDGFNPYRLFCAVGCFRCFSSAGQPCSTVYSPGGHASAHDANRKKAVCRAPYPRFLSTVAWCIHSFCPPDTRNSSIEQCSGVTQRRQRVTAKRYLYVLKYVCCDG